MNRWISGSLALLLTSAVVLAGCGPSASQTGGSGTAKTGKVADELSAPLLRPEDAASKPDPNLKPAPAKPTEMKATDMTMAMLQQMTADMLTKSVGGKRIFILGTVNEVQADNAEGVSVTLKGYKQKQGRQLLLRCKFAATEQAAVSKIKVDDDVRIEGTIDGKLQGDVLEFKDCVLAPWKPAAEKK